MSPVLDPFYPIVDSAAWVEQLVPAGVRFIQLRMKDRAVADVRAAVRRSLAVCARHNALLVVNDYWQIALDEGARFIHLGQEDLAGADLAAIRAGGLMLGISTHDHDELEQALAADPDYVALGPIYQTTLKVMPWAPQGLERIGEWKRLIGERPLVAIGGITLERAAECRAAGADSIAMVTDIIRHPDPMARCRAWIAATRGAS